MFTVLMKYGYGGSKNNGNCSDDGESVRVQLLVIGVMQRKKSGSITVLLVFFERRSVERDWLCESFVAAVNDLVNHSHKNGFSKVDDQLNFSDIQYSVRLLFMHACLVCNVCGSFPHNYNQTCLYHLMGLSLQHTSGVPSRCFRLTIWLTFWKKFSLHFYV